MIEYCKKCGNMIVPRFAGFNKEGKPIISDGKVFLDGNVFCRYCATTCFYINGNMYRDFEELKKRTRIVHKR